MIVMGALGSCGLCCGSLGLMGFMPASSWLWHVCMLGLGCQDVHFFCGLRDRYVHWYLFILSIGDPIAWYGMAWYFHMHHCTLWGCILVRDVFPALPLLCSEAYAEYGLFLILSLSCLHLVGCILVWEVYPQSCLYSLLCLLSLVAHPLFLCHHSR